MNKFPKGGDERCVSIIHFCHDDVADLRKWLKLFLVFFWQTFQMCSNFLPDDTGDNPVCRGCGDRENHVKGNLEGYAIFRVSRLIMITAGKTFLTEDDLIRIKGEIVVFQGVNHYVLFLHPEKLITPSLPDKFLKGSYVIDSREFFMVKACKLVFTCEEVALS